IIDGPCKTETLRSFGDLLKEKLATLFGDKKEELNSVIDEACGRSFNTNKEAVKALSLALSDLAKTIPLEELEENSVEAAREINPELTYLNRLLNYGITGDEIHIHIMHASTLSAPEKITLLNEAFQELAAKLKDKPELKNIQTISGTSWIFKENPGLARKLGFTLEDDPSVKKGERRAVISTENFIKKYSK
ncbi:TPA: hypothetical protein DCQ44_01215, partial [Candidatus Taylorbacteria bacterium]|nr:hypothetical protein [Candidatus Taylorbacteria bacterium]